MKKYILVILFIIYLIPKNINAQNEGYAAAAAGILAIGGAIAAIEQMKENLEQIAVEQVLTEYPDLVNFELKTSSLQGTKTKDLSKVAIITFEVTNRINNEKFVLFAFTSYGWVNQYGVDFRKLSWKKFDASGWNKLMQNYIKTASQIDLSLDEVSQSKIVNKGVKNGSKFIVNFDKIGGDVYLTSDYSDEFKIIFNESSLGLYLKETEDLVQIGRKAIIRAHEHVNDN